MKTLITIILTALLTACGGGDIETTVKSDKAVAQPAIIVVAPPVIETPAVTPPEPIVTMPPTPATPEPVCSPTTYIPCGGNPEPPSTPTACNPKDAGCVVPDGMEYCDIWSYNPCRAPTWIPKQPK